MDLEKLSDALELIYELPLDNSKWHEVQALLSSYSNTIANHVLVLDQSLHVTGSNMYSKWGDQLAADAYKEYNEFYYQFDSGKAVNYSSKMEWQVITNEQITSDFEKRNCPLHNEFNKKFQCEQQLIIGANVSDAFVSIVSTRPGGDEFTEEDKTIHGLLSKNVIKAIQQSKKLESLYGHHFTLNQVMHDQGNATLIVDKELKVLWQNNSAKQLLDQKGDLSYLRGKLTFESNSLKEDITNLVTQAINASNADREKCELRKINQGGNVLALAIFSSKQKAVFASDNKQVGVIVIKVPKPMDETVERKLRILFDLTPSEAKLALAIAKGISLQQYSEVNHKSIHTVRSTTKAVMAKTNTNSQHMLTAKVHQLI